MHRCVPSLSDPGSASYVVFITHIAYRSFYFKQTALLSYVMTSEWVDSNDLLFVWGILDANRRSDKNKLVIESVIIDPESHSIYE